MIDVWFTDNFHALFYTFWLILLQFFAKFSQGEKIFPDFSYIPRSKRSNIKKIYSEKEKIKVALCSFFLCILVLLILGTCYFFFVSGKIDELDNESMRYRSWQERVFLQLHCVLSGILLLYHDFQGDAGSE